MLTVQQKKNIFKLNVFVDLCAVTHVPNDQLMGSLYIADGHTWAAHLLPISVAQTHSQNTGDRGYSSSP